MQANGDARAVLNALELAIETTPANQHGVIPLDLTVAEESIQRRAVLYDKDGDAHFDTISAFIKSMRGSDPDAALFWLAKMMYAGEDHLVRPEGSRAFAASAPKSLVQSHCLSGQFHEIFNEADPSQAYALLKACLDQQAPASD